MAKSNAWYRMLVVAGSRTGIFVDMRDPAALETARTRLGHRDLRLSGPYYEDPDPSSPCRWCLYFRSRSCSIEQVRRTGLGICLYAPEHWAVPEASLEIALDAGGGDKGTAYPHPLGRRAAGDTPAPADIVITIPPEVFDPPATTLTPVINYELARQMRREGIDVAVDVYAREQQFLPLIGSVNSATGRQIVSLGVEELMYLDTNGLLQLSKQPQADDYSAGRYVPEAAAWFSKTLQQEQTHQKWQAHLRQALRRDGWQVPDCMRKLLWADLSQDEALEACRILAQFYPFVNAADTETWYHLGRLERRHRLTDHRQLRAISAFGAENPGFVGCDHPLLQRSCPATKCCVADMYNDYVNPRLFA